MISRTSAVLTTSDVQATPMMTITVSLGRLVKQIGFGGREIWGDTIGRLDFLENHLDTRQSRTSLQHLRQRVTSLVGTVGVGVGIKRLHCMLTSKEDRSTLHAF